MLRAMSKANGNTDAAVRAVQTCYPQIYLACHTRHTRAASSTSRLSARDSSLLAHLDERKPSRPTDLARHLGVGRSTMSAALKRPRRLGYIDAGTDASDGRILHLRLTSKGAAAMRATSVLEPARVVRLLEMLSPAERRKALEGLALLAGAAQHLIERDARRA